MFVGSCPLASCCCLLRRRRAFLWRTALAYPPKLLARPHWSRKFCEKSIDPYPSPLWLGQQSSCACDCRNGNGDDEELERSCERTIFELVDSRKQRESNEADGEYVEGGPHLGCSVPDCRGVATASSVSGGLALTRIYRSTGPLRFRTMECDGAPVVAFLRLGKPHGTPPPTRLLPLGLG